MVGTYLRMGSKVDNGCGRCCAFRGIDGAWVDYE